MEKLQLHGIKPENVKSILIDIASRNKSARSLIAKDTSLSVMTVGKVADILLEAGIITEEKSDRVCIGRRAGLLSVKGEMYAAVIDLSERVFRLNIADMMLMPMHSMKFTYNKKYLYDQNLFLFFKTVRSYLDKLAESSLLFGVGISVPGIYLSAEDHLVSTKIPELETIPIRETAEKLLGRPVSLIKRNVESAALSYAAELPGNDRGVIVYMFIGESVDGAVYSRGGFEEGAHEFGCDFGRMNFRCGQTLEDRVGRCTNDYMIADEITDAVYNLITIFDPDVFIIESDILREPELFIDRIRNSLVSSYKVPRERLPEFPLREHGYRHSARGLAMSLREMWADSIL